MNPEIELQREVFGIWLKNLRRKSQMIQSFADKLCGQHGLQQMGKMLNGFAKDCERLYELGYEVGYVQGVMNSGSGMPKNEYLVN